jgi:uncharacterized protein
MAVPVPSTTSDFTMPHVALNLSHDPVHGYIPFTSSEGLPAGETSERDIIDHPWLQRLRYIHQLQTAWWVFPTAEHSRFQHVLGAMHLGSRAVAALYDSLLQASPPEESVPSRGYVESLVRMAGLLHDVGHGPFGHFLDDHLLNQYRLTHETLGARIIVSELGELLRGIRSNPNSRLADDEQLSPDQIAWLIQRPQPDAHGPDAAQPRWLHSLRCLLSGIYTIDNMDFVLRDAYMSGYSARAYDLDRLLHYSFFSPQGLTIHDRGIDSLIRFMTVRSELFRTIYFHRTVRAIDLMLADLFRESRDLLFPRNPLEHLAEYQRFTESSLLVDVSRWSQSDEPQRRACGEGWDRLLRRDIVWKMACQRSLLFTDDDAERASIFTDPAVVEARLREDLPAELRAIPMRVDIARHMHRPHTRGPAAGQNYLYDSARQTVRPLHDHLLFRHLPVAHRICRVYTTGSEHAAAVARGLDLLLGPGGGDVLTNM